MISLPSISEVKNQLFLTAKRFPLPTLCAVILTLLGIYLNHLDYTQQPEAWIWKSILTAMLGLVSLSALTLVAETIPKLHRGFLMLAGTVLLGLYFWSLPTEPTDEGSMWITRHVFFMLGSLVALSWVPFWRQSLNNKTLWVWISDLIGNVVVTLFFGLVLFLGLAAALWSVEMLFDVDINPDFYFDTWIIIAALFSPLFFLSQFIPEPAKLKEPTEVSAFMGIFAKYIMTPLALGYLVILYSYTAKILITWEWPKNLLGWLVIAFLGVAIFTYFLWTPLLKENWEKYRRIFWLVLIPQIFLLFIAIGWRIQAYSWTENRYFVVILGLWLLGTTLYFLARKDAKFKWIFVALTALIFISQVGPLSGYNIAEKSQTNRLMLYLTELDIKQNNRYVPVQIDVNDNQENEVASILEYLANTFGHQKLQELFPESSAIATEKRGGSVSASALMQTWGLEYRSKWERNHDTSGRSNYRNFNIDKQQPLSIANYNWKLSPFSAHSSDVNNQLQGYSFKMSDNREPPAIKIYSNKALIDTISLAEKFDTLIEASDPNNPESLSPEESTVIYESDRLAVKIYLMNGWQSGAENFSFDAEIYVRLKN